MENGEQRDVCWNDECQQGKAGTMEIKKRSSEVMGRRWGQDRACSSLRSILRLQGNERDVMPADPQVVKEETAN